MTVTIIARHELTQADTCNGTCYTSDKILPKDHTESLLRNLSLANLRQQHDHPSDSNSNEQHEKKSTTDRGKYRRLFRYEEVPSYLAHNAFIRSGYRGMLNTKLCLESVFWWTNETINIWSHLFGFMLFAGLTFKDAIYIDIAAPWEDTVLVAAVLFCFQICMVLSSTYHTFSCRSETDFHVFLMYDLFGVAFALLGTYTSGIYYAFWCERKWRVFYIVSVTLIFSLAMVLQLPKLKIGSNTKIAVFTLWGVYGIIPTIHWALRSGGTENPVVRLLLPRVIGMYAITGFAFLVYITKVPERFCAGKFDYLGHSHQWWHLLIVFGLYYWHSSGLLYLEYRMNHACPSPSAFT